MFEEDPHLELDFSQTKDQIQEIEKVISQFKNFRPALPESTKKNISHNRAKDRTISCDNGSSDGKCYRIHFYLTFLWYKWNKLINFLTS